MESQTADHLLYRQFSVIYIQVFTIEGFDASLLCEDRFSVIDNSIDEQIFVPDPDYGAPVSRYRVKGFDFSIDLKDPYPLRVSGTMSVEVSVFFNRTVSVTYRMVVDGKHCKASERLTTDHMISLASLNMGAEHWSCDDDKKFSTINLDIQDISVTKCYLDAGGKWLDEPRAIECGAGQDFNEIQRRYRLFISREQHTSTLRDLNYVYLDVWEDVGHTADLFTGMPEPDIISHIYHKHTKELVGLMTLYPYEWPYRTDESFADVCGSNVAIDTDDLILVNQNMCIVFGTYGLRGKSAPTDWKKHLEERDRYHVSWPEYLLILEMVLAKKYTITAAQEMFLRNTFRISSIKHTRDAIESDAQTGLKVSKILLQLDAVKYSRYVSHKIMFDRTARRLELAQDLRQLDETMKRIDKSLFNISEMRKLKQSTLLNVILGCISAASLFSILFQRIEVPFLQALGLDMYAGHAGMGIIGFTLLLIVGCVIAMFIFNFRNDKIK